MSDFKDDCFYRLKAAQRDLIKACGGIERCSQITSISRSQVGRWNNALYKDLIPTNVICVLEAECGIAYITSALASLNGRRLEDVDVLNDKNPDIMTTFADAVRHTGDLMKTGIEALADGKITPAEATEMDQKAARLETQVANLRKALSQAKKETLHVVGGTK